MVSELDIETFVRDGAVQIKGAFERATLAQLADCVEAAMAGAGRYTRIQSGLDDPGLFFSDYWASERVPGLRAFAAGSPTAEIAGRLMQSASARFFFDAIWVKEPGTIKRSAWHQDQPYYCVGGPQVCIVWVPIDPVPKSVSLRCIRGSHRWNMMFAPVRFKDGAGFGRGDGDTDYPDYAAMPDFEADQNRYEQLSWQCEPGDCLVFHGMTVHSAPGNAGASRRRVVSTTWVGDTATYVERPGEMEPHRSEFATMCSDGPLCDAYFPTYWRNGED